MQPTRASAGAAKVAAAGAAAVWFLVLLLVLVGGSSAMHGKESSANGARPLFSTLDRQRREEACPSHVTKDNVEDVRSCIYVSVSTALNVSMHPPQFEPSPWRLMPRYYFAPTQQDDTVQLNVLSGLFFLQIRQEYSQLKVGTEQVFLGLSLSNDIALSVIITSNPRLLGSVDAVPTNSFFQTEVVAIHPVCAPDMDYPGRPLWNSETSSHAVMGFTVAASYHAYHHPCACAGALEDQCLHLLQPLQHTLGTVSGSVAPSGSPFVSSTLPPTSAWSFNVGSVGSAGSTSGSLNPSTTSWAPLVPGNPSSTMAPAPSMPPPNTGSTTSFFLSTNGSHGTMFFPTSGSTSSMMVAPTTAAGGASAGDSRRRRSPEGAADEAQDSVEQCATDWANNFITLGFVSAGLYAILIACELLANHRLLPWATHADKVYTVGLGFFDVTSFTFSLVQSQAPAFPLACAASAASITISAAVLQGINYAVIGIQLCTYLPLFLCITSRQRLLGFAFGFSYSLAFLVYSSRWLDCLAQVEPLNIMLGFPHVMGLALLASWFAVQLVLRLRLWTRYFLRRGYAPPSPGQEALQRLDRRAYVRMVLAGKKPSPQEEKSVSLLRVLPRALMGQAHYRLPSRLIAVVAMVNAILFSFIPRAVAVFKELGQVVEGVMSGFHCCNGEPCTDLPNYHRWLLDPLEFGAGWQIGDGERCPSVQVIVRQALHIGLTVCVVLAMLVSTGASLRMLIVYRRRMLRLFAGDTSFLPKARPTNLKTIASTVKFAGTAIALSIGAWLAVSFVLCITLLIIIFTTVLPLAGVYDDWFWHRLLDSLIFNRETNQLGILCTLIINYIVLHTVVKFMFLISSKRPGIKRPGFFGIVDMFEFYVYCFNGVIVLLTRVGMGMVFQVLFVARPDCITFPRGCEKYDAAFKSYMAFMLMDEYYSHPVFLCANWLLLDAARSKRTVRKTTNGDRTGGPHLRIRGHRSPSTSTVALMAPSQGPKASHKAEADTLKGRVRRLCLGTRSDGLDDPSADAKGTTVIGSGHVGDPPLPGSSNNVQSNTEQGAGAMQANAHGGNGTATSGSTADTAAASASEYLDVDPSHADAAAPDFPLLSDITVLGGENQSETALQSGTRTARVEPLPSCRRVRNKWMLLITLANNPGLAELRAHALEKEKDEDGDKSSDEGEGEVDDDKGEGGRREGQASASNVELQLLAHKDMGDGPDGVEGNHGRESDDGGAWTYATEVSIV